LQKQQHSLQNIPFILLAVTVNTNLVPLLVSERSIPITLNSASLMLIYAVYSTPIYQIRAQGLAAEQDLEYLRHNLPVQTIPIQEEKPTQHLFQMDYKV